MVAKTVSPSQSPPEEQEARDLFKKDMGQQSETKRCGRRSPNPRLIVALRRADHDVVRLGPDVLRLTSDACTCRLSFYIPIEIYIRIIIFPFRIPCSGSEHCAHMFLRPQATTSPARPQCRQA